MQYKVIATDFDGTLLSDDKKVSLYNEKTLLQKKKEGTLVIGATARNINSIKNVLNINMFNYLIINNGTYVYDYDKSKGYYEAYISNDICRKLIEEENKDDSKLFSNDLVSTLETKEKDITTGELLKRLFNGGPKNINPLTEIPQSQMRLYGFSGFLKSAFFDTEEELIEWIKNNDTSIGDVCIIDYLGNVAGRDDVIRLTYKNGKSDLYVACDEDGYGIYNNDRSIYKGVFVWEYNHGSISEMYSAFRDRGIIFENDIYGKIEERNRKIFEMINNNEKGPVLTKKKVDKDKK